MVSQVHIVPHMHWDREWYFTAEESQLLLLNNMEEAFTMLENNAEYPCYILDGQTAILEDYFSMKPDQKDRFQKLVKSGKLRIGPWYTQTDAMVVSGESITRNLLLGFKDCKNFGSIMKIGYLPDSFGQSAQMPMILNGFGIKRSMFWRGTSERSGTNKTEFIHKSKDGSTVTCQVLPLGYAIGKYLPENADELYKRMEKYFPVLDKGTTTGHILLPNGHDQMPIQKNIFQVMDTLSTLYPNRKFVLSDYESVFDQLREEDLDVIEGEFLDGKYMRVHRSIYSSRSDIKMMNTRLENKLTNILEPLATMAHSLGFEYYAGFIEDIWKLLLKNHAHDSIGCCCSDKVMREIKMRFELAEEKIDRMIDYYKRKITDAIPCDQGLDKVVAFNMLPYSRETVIRTQIITRMKDFCLVDENRKIYNYQIIEAQEIDPGLVDRQIVHYGNYDPFICYTIEFYANLPAMGYKTFLIQNGKHNEKNKQECDILQNQFYRIEIHLNGCLTIEDRETGRIYKDVLMLEDGADGGDSYDYSPIENDWILTSQHAQAEIVKTKFENTQEADVKITMAIPKDLEERKQKEASGSLEVHYHLTLKNNEKNIEFKLKVNNQAKDHRVRFYIPQCMASKYTVADNQFGQIYRKLKDPAMEYWKVENWSERPDGIYPMLSYVKMDKDRLTFITNSIREYEAVNDTLMAITLFRSTGYLGLENLIRRPGRPSGIKMETLDHQLLGCQTYEFALACTENDTAAQIAKAYVTPVVTYNKMPYNAMKMNDVSFQVPFSYSLLKLENSSFIVTALKQAEDKNGYILRGYNASNTEICVQIESKYKTSEIDLKEDPITSSNDILPSQVRTYRLI